MAITVEDFPSLLRVLDEHPEWLNELRRRILDEQFLKLPDWVRQNSRDIQALKESIEASRAAFEARFTRVEGDISVLKTDVAVLKTDVAVLKTDVAVLKTDVSVLKTDVAVLKTDVAVLKTDVAGLKTDVAGLKTDVHSLDSRVGSLQGDSDERKWKDNFAGRFGHLIRRAKLMNADDLEAFEDAVDAGTVNDSEALAVRLLDIIIRGVRGKGAAREEAYFAVEVSSTIHEHDVSRALERAAILRKVGYNAFPVVAGSKIERRLQASAAERGVEVVLSA